MSLLKVAILGPFSRLILEPSKNLSALSERTYQRELALQIRPRDCECLQPLVCDVDAPKGEVVAPRFEIVTEGRPISDWNQFQVDAEVPCQGISKSDV